MEEGLKITEDGYVDVSAVLEHKAFKQYSQDDIERVVAENEKQRFSLRTCSSSGKLQICANQGHSFHVSNIEVCLINFI